MIKVSQLKELSGSKIWEPKGFSLKSFSSVGIDSRTVRKNEIFFAIKGENTDGYKYIDNVLKKGIKAIVVNTSKIPELKRKYKDALIVGVKDTTLSLGELAGNHLRRFNVPVLCIGGANGKTTTKDLVAAVLSEKYNVLKTEGNLNNHIGLPLTLLKLNKSHQFCVLEVGTNHFGEIEYLCRICRPNFGLVTNIGKEHFEFFKNERGVARAEFELYDYIMKTGNGFCFYNLDDKYIRAYARKNFISGDVTYSYDHKAEFTARFKGYNRKLQPEFEARHNDGKYSSFKVSTFGRHSIYNGFAAYTAGMVFGVKLSDIKSALKNFKLQSSKRMQVEVKSGITFVNDTYNSNPGSVEMGLKSLKDMKIKGTAHIILGDMLELGSVSRREHSAIGKLVSEMGFKKLYTFGSESFHTSRSAKKLEVNLHFKDKESLSRMVLSGLKKGDVVYVKGSRGMKLEEVIDTIKSKVNL